MASSISSPAQLDHIIILVPHHDLLNPPAWLTSSFTLTPGGCHADNKTENTLVLFADGSYIELIAFIADDASLKEGHWWGDKKPGIIDFAFTTPGDAGVNYACVQGRLEASDGDVGVGYAKPVAGGRNRPDGKEIKWKVTFPQSVERGQVPFFCHDVTERELRVPRTEESTSHPCGAYGIKRLIVHLQRERAAKLASAYGAILGTENQAIGGGETVGRFQVARVDEVQGTSQPEVIIEQATKEGRALLGELVLGLSASNSSAAVLLDEQYRLILEPGLTSA